MKVWPCIYTSFNQRSPKFQCCDIGWKVDISSYCRTLVCRSYGRNLDGLGFRNFIKICRTIVRFLASRNSNDPSLHTNISDCSAIWKMCSKVRSDLLSYFIYLGLLWHVVPGGAMADFGRSVNPIPTRGGGKDYAHLITTGTPGFSDLPTAL